ncbi:flagellin [Photobacterium phosphoreum]|uniref:flagellin N-terminal helical domain-containing protein n=1 Tax=Photobacterium phosphoreum TaxID=659 RepID=UPI0007F8C6C7|nr:flagellin [Photobacterium phosphoreum]OBU31181.1 hypothetical protein AYY24_20180 [Photobacterium phosphoreum]PSU77482.1 flagellin [Photobacterium phosphoreum]PSW32586.1 flagellin [Photobacterium phosphoreum]
MLSINYNSASRNAVNQVGNAQTGIAKAMNALSTGNRINSAADDVAGSAMASRMQVQSNSLDTAVTNANMGVNLIQTMDGAMKETEELLQRMTKLTEMSKNDAYSIQDRDMMDQEFGALSGELDRNAQSANYNGISLINNAGNTAAKTIFDQNISKGVTFAADAKMSISIDGTALTKTIDFTANEKLSADDIVGKINQALKGKGANATLNSAGNLIIKSDTRVSSDGKITTPATSAITITDAPKELNSTTKPTNIPGKAGFGDIVINVGSSGNKYDNIYLKTVDLSAEGLGLKGASLTNSTGLDETLSTLKAALDTVTEQRSHLGASQKRLTFASDNLQNVKNNTDASLSSIEDTDYAATTMQLAKEKVLNSASQAMLGQSNQMQSEVTQLLK